MLDNNNTKKVIQIKALRNETKFEVRQIIEYNFHIIEKIVSRSGHNYSCN